MPFTREQFLAVFAIFNAQLWPFVLVLWLATALIVWRRALAFPRRLRWLLAALWLSSTVYHAVYFTRINPAAWLFGAAFMTQAALWVAPSARVLPLQPPLWREHRAAFLLSAFALAYPLVTMLTGERYPDMPVYGVPCPTCCLTAGVLLTVPRPVPVRFLIVPIAWCVVAGSAALLLGMRADLMLLVAGALLAWHGRPVQRRDDAPATPLAT